MPIGEESVVDVKLQGGISAADTVNEKIAVVKEVYPDGDLLCVPGKGTPERTLEGVPSKYSGSERLFRPDTTTPYARLDGNYFKGGGQEFLEDFAEFLYDDIGVLAGELAAGSKKVTKFMKPFAKFTGAAIATIPVIGPPLSVGVTSALTGYELLPLMTRMGLYGAAGEMAQEGVQEVRGVNEQSLKEIYDTAGYKGLVGFVGTGVAEPIVRKIGDVFSQGVSIKAIIGLVYSGLLAHDQEQGNDIDYNEFKVGMWLEDFDADKLNDVVTSMMESRILGNDRSEERRVGKECRSRWSPYH